MVEIERAIVFIISVIWRAFSSLKPEDLRILLPWIHEGEILAFHLAAACLAMHYIVVELTKLLLQ